MAVSGTSTPRNPGPGNKSRNKQGGVARQVSATQSLPKVLRIGIIQGGKILEERIIRNRETVTVGQSEKNTFVLATPEVGGRFDLFETRGGDYTLNTTKTMGGRVSIKGEVHEIEALRSSGTARRKGKMFQVPLTEESRGKVVIGDSTVLFQFVAPPPIQPRPQLPAAVRGGPFKSIDWFITTLWVVSFLLHGGMITWWETTDWPVVSKWEKFMQLEQMIAAEDASFEKKKAETEEGEGEAEEEEDGDEEQEEKPKGKNQNKAKDDGPKKSAAEIARERAERRAALAEMAAQRGINKILGALGGDGEGAIADVLRGGDVGADQDDLLSQVQGVGVASGDGTGALGTMAGGKDSGEAADISQIKMQGGDADVRTSGAGSERKVRGKVKRKNPSAVDGTGVLSPQEVAKVINRRMGAIKGCYERALRRDPTLKGKVSVRFTVTGAGKVSTARTTLNELTPEVGNCIVSAFKRFRFPPPEGGSAVFENPFLFMPSN